MHDVINRETMSQRLPYAIKAHFLYTERRLAHKLRRPFTRQSPKICCQSHLVNYQHSFFPRPVFWISRRFSWGWLLTRCGISHSTSTPFPQSNCMRRRHSTSGIFLNLKHVACESLDWSANLHPGGRYICAISSNIETRYADGTLTFKASALNMISNKQQLRIYQKQSCLLSNKSNLGPKEVVKINRSAARQARKEKYKQLTAKTLQVTNPTRL